jgi:hypothetical protein
MCRTDRSGKPSNRVLLLVRSTPTFCKKSWGHRNPPSLGVGESHSPLRRERRNGESRAGMSILPTEYQCSAPEATIPNQACSWVIRLHKGRSCSFSRLLIPSRMLKKSASGVLASLRGSTYRSVRVASSLAAALLDSLFEHPEVMLASAPYGKFEPYFRHKPSFSAAC